MHLRRSSAFVLLSAAFLSPTPSVAQARLPRFEPGACAFAAGDWTRDVRLECGALIVAQDRAHPERKSFRLAVAILHPKQASTAPPLVLLHGGPSGPGGLRSGQMALAVRWWAALKRDIVVYDQRGAGFSEPALCPDIGERTIRMRNETSDEEHQRADAASARQCVADLKRQGIDPAFFNSATNAADLIDLRTALGYSSWDVHGVSYGARLAQEVMRRDPKGVRSVILASPGIPGLVRAEAPPLTFQRALERIFAECAAQPACHAAFPSPEDDLYALHAEFSAKPLQVAVERDGAPATVNVDGRRLLAEMLRRYSTDQWDRLPLLLHELRRGNRAAAAQALVGIGQGNRSPNSVLTDLVMCNDFAASPEYRRASDAVKAQLKTPFHPFVIDGSECANWLEPGGARAEQLVRSDVPALILTNQFDDRSPTEHGRRIAAVLKRAYLFELPALGHGVTPAGCPDSIVFSFLADPTRPPDASCIAAMPRPAFSTDRLEQPRLFFTITAAGDEANPFAGKWEAVFPNAPRVFQFDLAIAGRTVSGAITAGSGALKIPVIEGAADSTTLMFRVKTPEGGRTITFTGTLDGDRISFVREVVVPPGGEPGSSPLWGATGARTFVATRARQE